MSNYGKLGKGQWLNFFDFSGRIICYQVFDKEISEEIPMSYALITQGEPECVLWHIHTNGDHRRKGYAEKLIGELQKIFGTIKTQINTVAGDALCLKCGFEKSGTELIWKEKKEVVV